MQKFSFNVICMSENQLVYIFLTSFNPSKLVIDYMVNIFQPWVLQCDNTVVDLCGERWSNPLWPVVPFTNMAKKFNPRVDK